MIQKIALKTVLIFVLLIVSNFIYTKWFFEEDIQKHSSIINLVRSIPNSADIIYLGESSNTTFRSDDLDKRPISDFIGDHFKNLNTCDITKPASHAGIYKVLLENLPVENKVKTIIVTMNLRSFNAQWIDSKLETSLQKSLVLLKPYPPLVNRFLLSFKSYDLKTEKEREASFKHKWKNNVYHLPFDFEYNNVIEWDLAMATRGIKDDSGIINQEKTNLACHYIKTYGFQIDTLNNERINDFDDIIELAKERNWNLVFNLLAENTDKAKELVGENLIYMLNENMKILTNYYERKGITVVNNLNSVRNEQFIDQEWTTEHYAENGRKTIAKNVSQSLRKWYNDAFKDVDYRTVYKTTFFNNCENGEVWGQQQTVTTEKSHSGSRSSVTGSGNDYSITLEYPLKSIPDSLKGQIEIQFWYYQESSNHSAEIIFQASGENTPFFSDETLINQPSPKINKWVFYSKTIAIPDNIKNADLIKVFVHNPYKEKVYIDDFKVEFVK